MSGAFPLKLVAWGVALTLVALPILGVLNGWRDGTIRRYYNGERPGPDVRVVHLFSSSNMRAFLADTWTPELVAA